MKLSTIVLATTFALSGTAALAQQAGTSGGSAVAPSVGSHSLPSVGTRSSRSANQRRVARQTAIRPRRARTGNDGARAGQGRSKTSAEHNANP
jgi:hypothetical protein